MKPNFSRALSTKKSIALSLPAISRLSPRILKSLLLILYKYIISSIFFISLEKVKFEGTFIFLKIFPFYL